MPQKLSPYLDFKWGWDYGESGWNIGMDENILKSSILLDGNIEEILDNPPTTNTTLKSYYLRSDNHIYFSVNNSWITFPAPLNKIFYVGETSTPFSFNGAEFMRVLSNDEIDDSIQSINQSLSETEDKLEQKEQILVAGNNISIDRSNPNQPIISASFNSSMAWENKAIGEPFPLWDNLLGVSIPPTNSSQYRFIKLSAADPYNNGVLVSESVTGSGALTQAAANINDPASPLNGQTVRLINTERRVIRAGASGTIEADSLQGHRFGVTGVSGLGVIATAAANFAAAGAEGNLTSNTNISVRALDIVSDSSNGTPRVSSETRAKNIGATYYMRIR